jgi:acyl-CoA synthetase (AMP-forming)/AMP-acid ligase II
MPYSEFASDVFRFAGHGLRCRATVVLLDTGTPAPPAAAAPLERTKVHGQSLEGNLSGDSPDRDVSVYLPPSDKTQPNRRYPVLDLLHGFTDSDAKWFGLTRHWINVAEVIDRARWMHTGDLAVMDADGYLNIVGRIKDMVIRGGENVYPREIEEFLYTHPDVVDAQVIGVPDERYGEELMAWVRLRDGAEPLTAESLREFL